MLKNVLVQSILCFVSLNSFPIPWNVHLSKESSSAVFVRLNWLMTIKMRILKAKRAQHIKKDENKCATVCTAVRKMFWKFLAAKFWGLLSHVWGCSAHLTWEKSFNLIPLHLIFFSFLNSILETPEVKKHMYAGTTHACQNTRWLDYEIEKLSTHSTLSRATCWALLYAYFHMFHLWRAL